MMQDEVKIIHDAVIRAIRAPDASGDSLTKVLMWFAAEVYAASTGPKLSRVHVVEQFDELITEALADD